MKTIRNWNDLEQYGVNMLTGEACGYGYRLLCDLTEDGIKLVADCLGSGLEIRQALPQNWNSKSVASIMLAPQMFQPLAVFALFNDNCRKVYIMYDGTIHGVEADDDDKQVESFVHWHQGTYCEACQRYGAGGGIQYQYSNPGYSRNTHQMSGRTT